MFVILFVIILGVLVLSHEFGHFLAAKKTGVKVEEFGVGIPPRLFGKKIGETLWSLNLFPIGGFVKLFGEDSEEHEPRSFSAANKRTRLGVLFAGVFMNAAVSWILFSVLLAIGFPSMISEDKIGEFQKSDAQIIEVFSGSPAREAGIQPGDHIVAARAFQETPVAIKSASQLQAFVESNRGKQFFMTVERGGIDIEKEVFVSLGRSKEQGLLGVSLATVGYRFVPWYKAAWSGLLMTGETTFAIIRGLGGMLKDLVLERRLTAEVAGPVGIALLSREIAGLGFAFFTQFIALISLHLAVLNILPIPALDGGRVLFVLIEAIKGSPVNRRAERWIHSVSFAILLVLIILITIRDVSRFF